MKYFPDYLDARNWSRELNVKINTVDPSALPDATTGLCPNIKLLTTKTCIFDTNLQKQKLSEYNLGSKIKQQEWNKYIADKKAVMNLVRG